jgi:hypothetical protein
LVSFLPLLLFVLPAVQTIIAKGQALWQPVTTFLFTGIVALTVATAVELLPLRRFRWFLIGILILPFRVLLRLSAFRCQIDIFESGIANVYQVVATYILAVIVHALFNLCVSLPAYAWIGLLLPLMFFLYILVVMRITESRRLKFEEKEAERLYSM